MGDRTRRQVLFVQVQLLVDDRALATDRKGDREQDHRGEHSDEVLSELGYSADALADMKRGIRWPEVAHVVR